MGSGVSSESSGVRKVKAVTNAVRVTHDLQKQVKNAQVKAAPVKGAPVKAAPVKGALVHDALVHDASGASGERRKRYSSLTRFFRDRK